MRTAFVFSLHGPLLGPLLGALFLAAVAAGKPSAAAAPERAMVVVETLKQTDDVKRFVVPVRVEAKLRSALVAEIEGWVTKINKPLGSTVKVGEIVLYIENKDPTFTFAAVPVRSPVAGVISQMDSDLMARVQRGDKLFSVIDPRSLKLTAEIAGADLPFVKPGSKASFKPELADKGGQPVKVSAISPLVDPRTGTASAELTFEKGAEHLPNIGSVGHVVFEVSRGKVLLVQEAAVGYSEGKPVVKLVRKDGTIEKRGVELGEQRENLLVVKSGVSSGDKVVLRANRALREGEAVEVDGAENK